MKTEILKQEYKITNPFNETMAIDSLKRQLSSAIFNKLIKEENEGLILTFKIELIESEETK